MKGSTLRHEDAHLAFMLSNFPCNPLPFLYELAERIGEKGTAFIQTDEAKAILWIINAQAYGQLHTIDSNEEWRRLRDAIATPGKNIVKEINTMDWHEIDDLPAPNMTVEMRLSTNPDLYKEAGIDLPEPMIAFHTGAVWVELFSNEEFIPHRLAVWQYKSPDPPPSNS